MLSFREDPLLSGHEWRHTWQRQSAGKRKLLSSWTRSKRRRERGWSLKSHVREYSQRPKSFILTSPPPTLKVSSPSKSLRYGLQELTRHPNYSSWSLIWWEPELAMCMIRAYGLHQFIPNLIRMIASYKWSAGICLPPILLWSISSSFRKKNAIIVHDLFSKNSGSCLWILASLSNCSFLLLILLDCNTVGSE